MSVAFHTHRGKAAALALIFAAFGAGSGYVAVLDDATIGERLAGVSVCLLFGWGLLVALGRLVDRRAALVIDERGVRDRRMKIDAPWALIRSVHIWVQELDAAKAHWIALDVTSVAEVRKLPPLWAWLRRATLERMGRPPVALNLQGLNASPEAVVAAIGRFRPDLVSPGA